MVSVGILVHINTVVVVVFAGLFFCRYDHFSGILVLIHVSNKIPISKAAKEEQKH